jgi:hypothetical protein
MSAWLATCITVNQSWWICLCNKLTCANQIGI